MNDWNRTLVSIAIDAAKNCIDVVETEYPADDRPRRAVEAAEKWLKEPTRENAQALEKLEIRLWRSKDWGSGKASIAVDACAAAARAARHPLSSAMDAIKCEKAAHGTDWDYSRKWLLKLLRNYGSRIERIGHETEFESLKITEARRPLG
jgi:hypothetical protein